MLGEEASHARDTPAARGSKRRGARPPHASHPHERFTRLIKGNIAVGCRASQVAYLPRDVQDTVSGDHNRRPHHRLGRSARAGRFATRRDWDRTHRSSTGARAATPRLPIQCIRCPRARATLSPVAPISAAAGSRVSRRMDRDGWKYRLAVPAGPAVRSPATRIPRPARPGGFAQTECRHSPGPPRG